MEESRLSGRGLKERAEGNRKGGKVNAHHREGRELFSRSVKGDLRREESCPRRISESFLQTLKVLYHTFKKSYGKDVYYFLRLLQYSFYVERMNEAQAERQIVLKIRLMVKKNLK